MLLLFFNLFFNQVLSNRVELKLGLICRKYEPDHEHSVFDNAVV